MNRSFLKSAIALLLLVSWFAVPAAVQEKFAGDAGAYDVVPNWSFPYPNAGYVWGSVTGIFAESANRVFVVMRGEIKVPTPQPPNFGGFYGSFARNAIGAPGNEMKNCIFVLGADGRPVETWTQWDELCRGVHKVLKWRLNGDAESAKYFEGAGCRLCTNPIWEVEKRNMS